VVPDCILDPIGVALGTKDFHDPILVKGYMSSIKVIEASGPNLLHQLFKSDQTPS
jgi:hypothetical protein